MNKVSTIEDLMALGKGDKFITLTDGKTTIHIKKLTAGDFSNIMKAAKGDDQEAGFMIATFGILEPKMTILQVKDLPMDISAEIIIEIQKFSGMDKDSVERIRNLSGMKPILP
jgi:MoaA/NifB/PqqE/SkfB family radical SAM enzyme